MEFLQVTIREAFREAESCLQTAGINESESEAIWMLSHLLEASSTRIRLRFDEKLAQTAYEKLGELVEKRCRRVPLQHVLGSAPFLNLDLHVTRDVLIPRPETETLALRAIEIARSKIGTGIPIRILDAGTGSGCLAISIAGELPGAEVLACDVSDAALDVARKNADACRVRNIRFVRADLLSVSETAFSLLDILVSNPPYIPTDDIAGLQIEVRDHDPRLALDGGADGLDFYRRLAVLGRSWLRSGGWMLMEFGDGQSSSLVELFSNAGWNDISVEKDLSGRDRVLIVRSP